MTKKSDTSPEAKKSKSTEIATISLDTFTVTQAKLEEFLRSFTNLVITPETLPDAKKALASIKQMRYDIQNEQKQNDSNRNEWNKRMMNSNKLKGDALIEMIKPVEDPIAAKVKEIEDAEKAEKDRIANEKRAAAEARTKKITDTGAIPMDGGYALADQWISAQEIENLPDTAFDRVVNIFRQVADSIAAEKLIEEKKAALITERTNELYVIGMLRGQSGFVMPFPSSTAMSDEMLPKLNSGEWSEFMMAVKNGMDEQAKKDKELADQQAQFKKDQEDLQREKDALAELKKAALDERTAARKKHLADLGFIAYGHAMKFATISVFDELIISATDDEWKQILFDKTAEVTAIKEHNALIDAVNKCIDVAKSKGYELKEKNGEKVLERKGCFFQLALFNQDPSKFNEHLEAAEKYIANQEAKRIEALKPDKEKMLEYANAIVNIQVPHNMKSEEGHKLLLAFAAEIQNAVYQFKEKLK